MSVKVNRTAQRWSGGTYAKSPRLIVLHTTEGVGWPGYNNGGYAPHATIKPIPGKGIEVREHIPFSQSARALVNESGGVETNRAGAIQFELMGTCDANYSDKHGWYYWPTADDAVMKALADYLKPIMNQYGIPARCSVTFKDYNRGQVPSSYGKGNGVRLSFSSWNSYKGILGHQHVPENSHGDPGNFKINTLLKYLGGSTSTKPQPSTGGGKVPAPTKPTKKKLVEDGLMGRATTAELQRFLGVKVDSVRGPVTNRALQKWLGVKQDSIVGRVTVRALQRKVGATPVDGIWGKRTTRALQRFLNKQ